MIPPRRTLTPRAYMPMAVDHLVETKRCALWAGMGLGKSVITLTALEALYFTGMETEPTLILGPLRVAQSTWPEEAAKWDHLPNIEVSAITGTPDQRLAALARDVSVYTTNYENLPWLVEQCGDRWPFKIVVADESTRIKNLRISEQTSKLGKKFLRAAGGVRSRGIAKLAHTKIRRWINLTGRSAPNGLTDLWGQTWVLDGGRRLGGSFEGFKQRWFQRKYNGFGVEPLPHTQSEIQEKLKDICLTIDAKDWFDLKDPIVTRVYVDLPAKARALYRDMEKRMFMTIQGNEIEAFNAASRTIKCLQLANGAAYLDPDADSDEDPKARKWVETHDAKLQALESIINEAGGMPILVAYHFKSDLARLRKAFPKGRHFDKNPQTKLDFIAGKIPQLFIHPGSGGHGVDGLQDATNIIAFFGYWWDLDPHEQVIGRIGPVRQMQSGHDRPVFVYQIIARDTVDEDVITRHESKAEVQDILMAAMKRRKAA